MIKRTLFALILLLSLNIVQAQEELIVFAAASLTDAYEEIGAAFEEANPGVEILFNFGGSSTLAAQLIQGAPADIFASANNTQMAVALDGERIVEPIRTFAKNRLVLIVPVDNPANIESLDDLANPGVNLILAAPDVPVRAYTDTMLMLMADNPAYGEAYRDAVMDNLVSEEPNVRQVSAKIALGEADAGIVYLSDVTPDIADDVLMFPIPDLFNTIATYPIAVTDDTDEPELANSFVEFILSDAGQDILIKWGFVSVRDGIVTINDETSLYVGDFAEQTLTFDETTFTGVPLSDLIHDAQPADYIIILDAAGNQSVIEWTEIESVLIIYSEDGLQLIVPGDAERNLDGVVHIHLMDD